MSLINAINMGDHALISADTDVVFPDGSRSNVSKLLTFPHANAVLAFRGNMGALADIYGEFCMLRDFDEMLKLADLVMTFALAKQGKTDFAEDYVKGAEIILAGYSEKAGKITVNHFRCKAFGEPVEENLDVTNAICPGDLGINLDGITASKAGLIKLTGRQVARIRENAPECAAGGFLMIAEISPCSIVIENLGAI
jgi:hypothetical protein